MIMIYTLLEIIHPVKRTVCGVVNGKDIPITCGPGVRDFHSDTVTIKLEGHLVQVPTLTPPSPKFSFMLVLLMK